MRNRLVAHLHQGVTLLPVRRTPGEARPYDYGAHAADGAPIAALEHRWIGMRAPEAARRRLLGTAIYAGPAMMHFGHFLIEGLARLWALRRHPELPILWHPMAFPFAHGHWPGWMERLVAMAGLGGNSHHLIREPLAVERLIVPELGYEISERLHPEQAAALAVVPDCGATPGLRIWLSRADLPHPYERADGEAAIEAILAAAGWRVVRPEALPIKEQAQVFMRADVVAGMAGSAFHALLLAAAPRARLLLLHRPGIRMENFDIIAAARGVRQDLVGAEMTETGRVSHWRRWRFVDPARVAADILEATASGAPRTRRDGQG